MAKKKNNTLLYAGLGLAAAILLLKKKDTGMAGVGSKNNYVVQIVTARGKIVSYVCDSLEKCYKYKHKLLRDYKNPQLLTVYKKNPYELLEIIQYPNENL